MNEPTPLPGCATQAFIRGVPVREKERGDHLKLPRLDWRVQFLLELWASWVRTEGGVYVLITDVDTPGKHSLGSVHYARRAVDLGLQSIGAAKTLAFAQWVNRTFEYGRGYKAALHGTEDPTGKHDTHLHLQTPPPFQASGRMRLWTE